MIIGLDTAANRWHARTEARSSGYCSALKGKAWENADDRRKVLSRTFREFLVGTIQEKGLQLEPWRVIIFCEEPIAGKNGKTTRLLGLACGALWEVANDLGCQWVWVDIAHWKKVVVGNGNADKDKIAEWVKANRLEIPEAEAEVDLYDADCLLAYGEQTVEANARPATLP